MYRIGQFRRPQFNSYSTPLTITMGEQVLEGGDLAFKNPYGELSEILDNQNHYCIRFGVAKRKDSEQVFYLKLRNSSETEDNEQIIDEFKVGSGESSNIVYFEAIISPNSNYNQVIWELRRTTLDYTTMTGSDPGRKMIIQDCVFTKLNDVLTYLKQSSTYEGLQYLTKIGVQGPPSLLMCINGEQIRIGKTGIYEINHDDIKITSISFVPKIIDPITNELEYFIMDFEY